MPDRFRDHSVDPNKEHDLARQLIEESTHTVHGIPLDFDPRESNELREEEARLRRIADSLLPPVDKI